MLPMKNRTSPIETDADAERAWVAALSDEQIGDPMHTSFLKNVHANYGNDADVMMTSN